jgi:hypothetical protein
MDALHLLTMTTEIVGIKFQFEQLRDTYRQYLPKVDPRLIEDLLLRQEQNPEKEFMYTIEVFSDGSRNTEDVRNDILANTGMAPSIHDNGTHYVVNHKITLETLYAIQKYPDVIEIKGEYSGAAASRGAAHDRGEFDNE